MAVLMRSEGGVVARVEALEGSKSRRVERVGTGLPHDVTRWRPQQWCRWTMAGHADRKTSPVEASAVLLAMVVAAVSAGCRSTVPVARGDLDLPAAVEALTRPLPGDMAALYSLRVPSSGGLRMSVLTVAGAGRLTVSEPFGAALSVTAWTPDGRGEVYDLREGCRFAVDDVAAVLGAGRLPLPQVVRLLGGRLPAVSGDAVRPARDGRVVVEGSGWACAVTVSPEPWRVVAVDDLLDDEGGAWRVELGEHTSTLPGLVRVEQTDGRKAELRLLKLQWDVAQELPALPTLPPCEGGVP